MKRNKNINTLKDNIISFAIKGVIYATTYNN